MHQGRVLREGGRGGRGKGGRKREGREEEEGKREGEIGRGMEGGRGRGQGDREEEKKCCALLQLRLFSSISEMICFIPCLEAARRQQDRC